MKQTKRHAAIVEVIAQIENDPGWSGAFLDDARILLDVHIGAAQMGRCAVCEVPLIGKQELLCQGHWDHLVFDQPRTRPFNSYIKQLAKSLRILESGINVVRTSTHWMGAVSGRSRCEVCDTVTTNVEKLVNGDGETLKSHIVCEAHCTFRWEE
jgi:hypothetical protein